MLIELCRLLYVNLYGVVVATMFTQCFYINLCLVCKTGGVIDARLRVVLEGSLTFLIRCTIETVDGRRVMANALHSTVFIIVIAFSQDMD